ncbi:MFS transporter, partial [Brevibacterium aurantiacum]|uniref:MFS transporter n=1 Tax=Brevibacterium aurantiacum TaxID=273384 RepID=UPI003F977069
LAIMGFGGGALIASPMSNQLMSLYGGGAEPEHLVAGLTPTFVTLGIVYAVVIAAGAFVIRVPHPEWTPKGFDPAKATTKPMQTTGNVSVRNAIRTPQFWLLWVALFLNVTAGIGILENAAPMIQSYFGITAAAAAGFVGLLSIGNMGGRFIWSTTSDYLGRKNNYMMYLGVGAILYLLVALFGGGSIILFVLATLIIISFYGGGFSTVPAYLKDLFGVYQVGAIHGALLTAWSAAGVAGPLIVNSVVEAGEAAGKEGPELYTPGMYIMVGALVVGFIANVLVRPVSERFFEREDVKAKQAAALEDDN